MPYQGIPNKYEDLNKLSTQVSGGYVYPKFS